MLNVYLKLLKEYYNLKKKSLLSIHTIYISKEYCMNYYFLPEGNLNNQTSLHLAVKLSAHLLPLGILQNK